MEGEVIVSQFVLGVRRIRVFEGSNVWILPMGSDAEVVPLGMTGTGLTVQTKTRFAL